MAATAQMNFIKPLELYNREKPYWLFLGRPDHMPDVDLSNVQTDLVTEIPLQDVRSREATFSLEKQGFKFIEHGQDFEAFDNEQCIIDDFLPQVERVIKDNIVYAKKVHIYDWRVSVPCRTLEDGSLELTVDTKIRKETSSSDEDDNRLLSPVEVQDRNFPLAPSSVVHTGNSLQLPTTKLWLICWLDSTEFSLRKRVKAYFPEEANHLLEGRVQMIK